MGATLQVLLELQDVELQIVDIRGQLAARERRVQTQHRKVEQERRSLEEERAEIKRAQADLDELDLGLKTHSEHANRLREHLNTVKTNKEYAAVLSQLNTEKADATRLETRALEKMGGIETRKTVLTERQEAVRRAETLLEDARSQLASVRDSFADRLTELERRRDQIGAELDAKTSDLFNRVSERYDGEVMSRVVRTHPRRDEFICEGCHMGLAAEMANALMTRDEVRTCGNCGRILHIEKGA